MRTFVYATPVIPQSQREDCVKLMSFFKFQMHIEISFRDTYLLWKDYARSLQRHWVPVTSKVLDEDTLLCILETRGYFI